MHAHDKQQHQPLHISLRTPLYANLVAWLSSVLHCLPHAVNVQASTPAFSYLSFKAIGERIPLAAVQVRLFPDSDWLDMARSGADYWQIIDYSTVPKDLNPADPLDFKLTCSDGTILTEPGLVPADMFCNFQDPACKYHTGTVQC